MRPLATWLIAFALVLLVGLQIEERQDRKAALNEQRYQSCMAEVTGFNLNYLALDTFYARVHDPGVAPLDDEALQATDEAMKRCGSHFDHTSPPTTR